MKELSNVLRDSGCLLFAAENAKVCWQIMCGTLSKAANATLNSIASPAANPPYDGSGRVLQDLSTSLPSLYPFHEGTATS